MIIIQSIKELDCNSIKDLGKLIGSLKKKYPNLRFTFVGEKKEQDDGPRSREQGDGQERENRDQDNRPHDNSDRDNQRDSETVA